MTQSELQVISGFRDDIGKLFASVNDLKADFVLFRSEVNSKLASMQTQLPPQGQCDERLRQINEHKQRLEYQGKRIRSLGRGYAAVAGVFAAIGMVIGWLSPMVLEKIGMVLKRM